MEAVFVAILIDNRNKTPVSAYNQMGVCFFFLIFCDEKRS